MATSPLLSESFQWELQNFYQRMMSKPAYNATIDAARQTPAVEAPNLVIIETEGATPRRMYTAHPDLTEWLRLERTCVMENDGFAFIHTEALH
jgi:hypothetical protein